MPLDDYLEQHNTYRQRPHERSSTSIQGTSVEIGDPQTTQQIENTVLGSNIHGVPRGDEAWQARKLGESWPMEIIKNAINDQLAGGELASRMPEDDEATPAASDLWSLFRDILEGPHLQGDDWGDLVSAVISDLVDVGHGYWEPIPSENEQIPAVALKPVDALTVRHNVNPGGDFGDPPYYQAPLHTLGGSVVQTGQGDMNELNQDDLVVMRYPGSNRSNRVYPRAPGMQVQAALEHLTHSTVHSARFYNDNEIPAGFLQIMKGSDSTLDDVEETIKNASGDPRKVGVVGGDGAANWVEMGGTALNLSIIEEQQWFLQLCLAAFGLTKGEIAMTEDVNYNTSQSELSIVNKRVTVPLLDVLEQAVTRQFFTLFDSYQALPDDQRFALQLRHTDPREERALEEHLRERFESGGLPYNEYRQRLGEDPGETVIEIEGEEIDYGAHPRWVTEERIRDLRQLSSGERSAARTGGDGQDPNGGPGTPADDTQHP